MKKLVCVLLAICLVAVLCVSATYYDKQADALKSLGIFQGTNNGYELDQELTREQGVVMIIRLLGKEEAAKSGTYTHPFTDFKNYPWAEPYIGYAFENGIALGVGADRFGYGETMTDAMFLTMLLRVLGYEDANDGSKDFVWDNPYSVAASAGLTNGHAKSPFLRDDMVNVCWNALSAKEKGKATTLASSLIASGVFTRDKFNAAVASVTGGTTSDGGSSTGGGGSSGGGSSTGGGGGKPSDPAVVSSVTLSRTQMTLTVGGSSSLTATVLPDTATDKTVTWTSSDESVATVVDGLVSGVSGGNTTVTATAGDKSATCEITVVTDAGGGGNRLPWIPIT